MVQNFSQILRQVYQEAPDQTAVFLLDSNQTAQEISYRTLTHNAFRYTSALQSVYVRPGEVVILILKHGCDLLYAFFGCILNGNIPSIMPFLTDKLSTDVYRESLSSLFKITAPSAIITYQDFHEEVLRASRASSVRHVLTTEEINHHYNQPDRMDFELLPGISASKDDIVLLQHSSGTTGLQKGVALSNDAVFNQINHYRESLNLGKEDVIVSWLPLYHDMGLIAGFILPILTRIPLVLMSPFDWVRAPHRLLEAITNHRGTLCWLPNFAYNFCAQKIRPRDLEGIQLSSVRAFINCSEPMYWDSHKMFYERFSEYGLCCDSLSTSYAMAENVFAVTQGGIDSPVTVDYINKGLFQTHQIAEPVIEPQTWEDSFNFGNGYDQNSITKMLSAGKPISGTHICIVDEGGNEKREREIGEITIRSDCMLTGYYNRPDLTKDAFRDGWYLTGDLGYLMNGELFVTGRKKDLIIVGGKNIYPQDIENIAGKVGGVHPGRVAAFGVFNPRSGTEDVVVVAESDLLSPMEGNILAQQPLKNPQIESIASQIREEVNRSSDIALRYVYIVGRDWLLKTSSGKVARRANRDKYLELLTH